MKNALVIGGARSGSAVSKLLKQQGYDVYCVSNQDFKERVNLESMGIHVILDDTKIPDGGPFNLVVKNPGISDDHVLVKQFDRVLNEIQIAAQFASDYKIHAISGTNGKTTTVSMLYQMLQYHDEKALLAGNIGIPFSECVYYDGNFKRDVALEISAFQMDGTPDLEVYSYCLLNLTPDHLDRYENELAYYQAKIDLAYRTQFFIRNIDDENIVNLTHELQSIDVSLDKEADVFLYNDLVYYDEIVLFDVRSLKVVGRHNIMNAMFAAISAYLAGVSPEDIATVLSQFTGVEHRIEFVADVNGVRYYNDSKATNPESTDVCLKAFNKPVILLAGGYDKEISFDLLLETKDHVKQAILFGATKYALQEIYPDAIIVDNLQEATRKSQEIAEENDIVVLSPASASYDQFSDFEERGNKYKEYVKTLV